MQPRHRHLMPMLALVVLTAAGPAAAGSLQGRVMDLNGRPVAGTSVSVQTEAGGPDTLTVFSGPDGQFRLPEQAGAEFSRTPRISVRALNHELIDSRVISDDGTDLRVEVLVRPVTNQAGIAPPSAWLKAVADQPATATFILDCIGCHQVPAPQFRDYANAIANVPAVDRVDAAHRGWKALVQYMNYISAAEFGRGPEAKAPDARNVYSVGDDDRVIDFITRTFPARMDVVSGYDWGAPLAVTPATLISEYEIPAPNAVREAVLLGSTPALYVADVAADRLFRVDPRTGARSVLEIPTSSPVGPHSLHRGPDGSLWVAPFVTSIVARLDVETGSWQRWPMRTLDGRGAGIHDLSFGSQHTVLTDPQGRVWFSDIVNDSVGYLDPANGAIEIYPAPDIKGRPANGSLYGLAMNDERTHVWYSQLNGGGFGSFNLATRKFETSVELPLNSGPRRLAISDAGVLYVPLYGTGQLIEYDTRAKRQVGIYNLPDRASAPYAVTWDPVRRVVWIPTSNADVIYRFDPRDKSFAVLPMPRTGALLRMVDVDPATGRLVTSYANIVEQVHGPRMALIIEPGDGAYAGRSPDPAGAAPLSGEERIRAARCQACHDLTEPLIGPPYRTIAQRYSGNSEQMVEILATKIRDGGGGNWGVVPMVPNEHVTPANARAMARWILEQAPSPAAAR